MKSMLIGAIVACLWLLAEGLASPGALPACADQQLVITGDQKIEVYVDGVRATLPNANDWRKSDTVKVPASAKVIGVKAENRGRLGGGILASGRDFVTDRSWKCTADYAQGWEAASFDDSGWSAATAVSRNGEGRWGKIDGIDNNAFWIWTRRFASDNVVFCRKALPPCNPCPVTGTGPACITSCVGRTDGDYQSCKGCDVYATCSNGVLTDDRRCTPSVPGAPSLVWDDALKRCEYTSETCKTCDSNISNKNVAVGTGPACITSCVGRLDGDYQSCKGCNVYATCSNGILTDDRRCNPSVPGAPSLVWDDALKRCEYTSNTCKTCDSNISNKTLAVGTGPTCITSCKDRLNGDYQSCKGCKVYATCSNGILTDDRPCAASNPPLVWDDTKKTCERESTTCT